MSSRKELENDDEKILDPRILAVLTNIRTLRLEKGHTVLSFAATIEMSRAFLQDIEKGRKVPTLKSLVKIADGLEVPIKTLFDVDVPQGKGSSTKKNRK